MYNPKRRHTASNASLKAALFVCLAAMVVLVLVFFDNKFVCHNGNVYKNDVTTLDLRGAQEINIDRLCNMRSLEYIDLRQSVLTVEQAEELNRRIPECELVWSIPIAGKLADSNVEELDLNAPTESDFEMLRYFDRLERVNITNCQLYDLMKRYKEEMPQVRIVWTVPIGGREYKSSTVSIKLPNATAEDIDQLQYLPQLSAADMSGCREYAKIMEFAASRPECHVVWTVDLLGKEIGSGETEVDISGTKVNDLAELEEKISYLPKLEKLIMCDCGLNSETLDALDSRLENVKVVWRIYFAHWSVRTDATAFSTQQFEKPTYRLVDREVTELKYCRDLEMLDLGHNALTSVEPFTELTNLKVLILADNQIADISSLNKLTKMEYFEMFINRVSDISVVENMPNLTDVNFCWNRISDPSPLYGHQHLERVWMCGGQMSGATKRQFIEALPGVEFDLYSGYGSTNGNWRNNANFGKIRDAFRNHNGMTDYHW